MNDPEQQSFEELSNKDKQSNFMVEMWEFLRYSKKWWLMPVVVAILLLGLLMFLSGTAAAPFIYTFF